MSSNQDLLSALGSTSPQNSSVHSITSTIHSIPYANITTSPEYSFDLPPHFHVQQRSYRTNFFTSMLLATNSSSDSSTDSTSSNTSARSHMAQRQRLPTNTDILSLGPTSEYDRSYTSHDTASRENMTTALLTSIQQANDDMSFEESIGTVNTDPSTDSEISREVVINCPIPTLYFPNHLTLHLNHDDDMSISSIASDSTANTTTSTITSSSNDPDTTSTLYHNPRYLGCLDYYFPPRLQPLPTSLPVLHPAIPIFLPRIHDYPDTIENNTQPTPSSPPGPTVTSTPGDFRSSSIQTTLLPVPINIPESLSQLDLEAYIPILTQPTDEVCMDNQAVPTNPITTPLYQATLEQCWDNFQDSSSNVRPNDSWGDTIEVKCDNTVRIYFQNVNSFGLSQGTNKVNTILRSMQTMECDIATFVQTSINWRFLHLRNRLRMSLQRLFPIHKLNIARNKFNSEQPALPGGCAQIVTGNWSGRVIEFIHDFRNMGRWCGVKLRLKGDRHLYLITAYRVCQQSSAHIGPETAYRQQELMLALEGFVSPDPRKQFILDLMKCIKEWQTSNDEVLVSMDVNEQIGDSAHGLTLLMRECKLIDLFHHHHGTFPAFETFDLGSKRLDYIIGSASLLPFTTRCGYLPFYQGIPSDHRGMFIDLSLELIDGLTQLEKTPTRHLHSAFQKDVFKYKHAVHEAFLFHDIANRANILFDMSLSSSLDDADFQGKLDELDSLILDIQLKAEESCCRKRTKFDVSDDIHFTKQCIVYWQTKRKEITRKRATSLVCNKIYASLPLAQQQLIDVATGPPIHNWTKTIQRLHTLIASHRKTMVETQHDQIENEAAYTGSTIDKVQAKRERIKKDKKLFNTLRHHFHPSLRSGITHIIVPDKDAANQPTDNVDDAITWKTETQPQQVLDRLFTRNVSHFGQAEGTPFTVSPLLDMFGYTGMTECGKALIQDGTIPTHDDTSLATAFTILERLGEDSSNHQTLSDLLTYEKFHTTIKKWNEATSTSPSGRHLGHYKSLISLDSYSSKYTEEDPDPGPAILMVLYQIAASAFQAGIKLNRWTKITTCMIEKLPGIPKINKLRVIHLYEADYNAFNKMIWQRGIVWDAHIKGTLNTAQSGSRPNRTCQETLMSKGQKYMFSSLTRTAMATMDNDAKSCYDRIVATVALLASHKFGVPSEFCKTVGETLKTMQFSIRTAMGDSTQTYCHSNTTPIHGVGQGGTASPAFWLLVSSILFDCYQRQATGMTMTDPTKTITIKQWLEAIVDDTSLFTNMVHDNDLNNLVRTLEKDSQTWEKFLSASGGCLELSKCFYYVLSWTFDEKGDAVPMTLEEVNQLTSPIHLQEYDKPNITLIASKSPTEAHKTLGVWKTMDGNVREHTKVLTNRSKNLANIVATSGLYPYQADIALRMIYTPAMCYSLPSLSISEKALDKIQYKALESFVPALGYNKGFPRAVVFGPQEFGGMGVPHLFTEMNVSKIEYLIMHIRNNSDLGKLFRINLNWIQMHAGISVPLFESAYAIPYLDNWFTQLHTFMLSLKIRLVIKNSYVPLMEREHDCCIMEQIRISNISLSKNQWRYVHNWRMYFQVHTISDITNPFGDQILPIYTTFPDSTLFSERKSKLLWPRQEPPTCISSFKLWVKCLRLAFLQGRSNFLVRPLGKWIVNPTTSESTWNHYIDISYSSIIICTDDNILRYSHVVSNTSCTTTFDLSISTSLDAIPDQYFPVQLTFRDNQGIASHNKQRMLLESCIVKPISLDVEHAIQQAPSWKKHSLQHFHIPDPIAFLDSLQNADKKVIVVSDGGLQDGKGSFGVAFGTFADDLAMIEGPAPGNSDLLTSLRSEAYGLLAGLAFLNIYITTHKVIIPSNRPIQLYSDNLGLVMWVADLLKNVSYPRMYIRPEADVLVQIEHEIKVARRLNLQLTVEHVKGHQDDILPYNELSRPAQLNVKADSSATNYLINGTLQPYDEFCDNAVTMYIIDNLITRDYRHQIIVASTSIGLRLYFLDKFDWSDTTPDLVWWQAHGKSLRAFNKQDQRRIRKYIFSWLPTCQRLASYEKDSDEEDETITEANRCPSCREAIETHKHLLQCQCHNRAIIKDRWFIDLNIFLSNASYTPPTVKELIFNHLVATVYPNTEVIPPPLPEFDAEIERAIEAQTKIGWHQLFFGRLSIIWGNIIGQHLHYNRISEKEMSIDRWGQTLIIKVFQLFLDIWQARNTDGHHLNEKNESQLTRQRIIDKITNLQESNPEVRHCDRPFVFCPMETLEQYSIGSLIAWHREAKNIIKAQKRYKTQHSSIRDFFPVHVTNPAIQNPVVPGPPPEPDPDPQSQS